MGHQEIQNVGSGQSARKLFEIYPYLSIFDISRSTLAKHISVRQIWRSILTNTFNIKPNTFPLFFIWFIFNLSKPTIKCIICRRRRFLVIIFDTFYYIFNYLIIVYFNHILNQLDMIKLNQFYIGTKKINL